MFENGLNLRTLTTEQGEIHIFEDYGGWASHALFCKFNLCFAHTIIH